MVTKEFTLSESDLSQYNQVEASIAHWSLEYTKAQLQADRLKGAVNSMYEARLQLMNGVLKTQDLDPAHIHQVNVNSETGLTKVVYDDSVPNPAADPSESGPVSPTAKPV